MIDLTLGAGWLPDAPLLLAQSSAMVLPSWLNMVMVSVLAATGLAMLLSGWRLAVGPTLADRVIAMDLLMIMALAAVALLSVIYSLRPLIDIAVVLALIMFVATIAFAWYLERSGG